MTRQELEELPDADLMARCVAPISLRMRAAVSEAARHAFLRQLTGAQGTLLAVWILFTHAEGGLTGFCTGYPHRVVDGNFWTLLETGLRRLDDHDMLSLTGRLHAEVTRVLTSSQYNDAFGGERDLDQSTFERLVETLARLDPEVMSQLDDDYRRILPGSLRLVARLIRDHASEFVSIAG